MEVSDPLVLFLMMDNLLDEQVAVAFLAHVLYLKLLVFFHETPIVLIYLLSHLRHGLQVLIQFLLFLLVVVLVLFLLFLFFPQLLLDLVYFFIESFKNSVALVLQRVLDILLGDVYFLKHLFMVGVDLFDVLAAVTLHEDGVLLLNLSLSLYLLALLLVVDVDSLKQVLVFRLVLD